MWLSYHRDTVVEIYERYEGVTWYVQSVLNALFTLTEVGSLCTPDRMEAAIQQIIAPQSFAYILTTAVPSERGRLPAFDGFIICGKSIFLALTAGYIIIFCIFGVSRRGAKRNHCRRPDERMKGRACLQAGAWFFAPFFKILAYYLQNSGIMIIFAR